jgi:hypothetical protein
MDRLPVDGRAVTRRAVLGGGLAAAVGLATAACGSGDSKGSSQAKGSSQDAALASPKPRTTGTPAPSPTKPRVDPASVKANELGLVPVLMYHRITPDVKAEFDRSPADFRAELQRIFGQGYRPVRTIDLVRGQLDVPAGMTPVVLSFDDGYPDQFRYTADGTIDPTCGVGILIDVAKQFPDCRPVATMNINKSPFGLSDPAKVKAALTDLDKRGIEVANHTYGHDNLSKLDAEGIQKDFVLLQRMVHEAVPRAAVRTMALPFGVWSKDRELAHTGTFDGEPYTNEGILLVGANPSPSPYAAKFDPLQIPRIRSTSYGNGKIPQTSNYWLDYLEANAAQRYVSAGNPGKVTFPKVLAPTLAPALAAKAVAY